VTDQTPPRLAQWLLRRTLPPGARGDTIAGDLLEELRARNGTDGAWWYWRQALSLAVRYGWRRSYRAEAKRATRERKSMSMDNLWQDVRYALRSYAKAPSFTLAVLTTLALGIGASTAIFSFVDGILIRSLPLPDPNRLAFVNEVNAQGGAMSVSWPNFLDWRAREHSFDALAISRGEPLTLTGADRPRRLSGRRVTANFFRAVGIQPAMGPGFADADDHAGTTPVVIVSDAFWRNVLGADPGVIGRAVTLDSRPHTIVGVLPRGFQYLRPHDVFVTMATLADNKSLLDRGNHQGYTALGRLRPGVTLEAAERELQAIAADLQREHPDTNSGVNARAELLANRVVANVRQMLLVLLGAVGCLLLIACVNVANLLITRGAARQHELAIRAALGGGRLRLAGQLLVESSLVSAVGGALGVLLASGLLRVLIAVAPDGTPRLDEVRLDASALLFAIAASAICGVVFGAFPAFQASSADGQHVVIRGRTAGASARSHRLRRGLLAVEVALALILLVGAGLMVRTLHQLTLVDPGFRPDRLLTMRFALTGERWDKPRLVAFYNDLLGRVRAVPGISSAALTDSLPIDGSNWNSIFIAADKPVPPRPELPASAFTPVSDGYFEAMGMRLVRGRLFGAGERLNSGPTIVVNQTLAQRIWPGEDPIGKRLKQGWPEQAGTWREVVGVVADVKLEGVAAMTPLQVFLPLAHETSRNLWMVVRSTGDVETVQSGAEAALHAIEKDVPLYSVRTMDDLIQTSMARERMSLLVLVVFAGVALILASVGLYGVVAHGVTERTHEIGVRMALGAESRHVLGLVVRQGLSAAAVGAAIGLAGALALSRTMEGLLFGVTATDPLTFAAVILMLLSVTVVACYAPARRATRVDPTTALRTE
jgi:putative ABC transport system permease protein